MTRTMWRELLCAGALCLVVTACGPEKVKVTQSVTVNAHAHGDMAQHGGAIVEVGDHAAFVEIVHDEAAGLVQAWIRDGGGSEVAPDSPPLLNVPGDAPVQVEGAQEGGAWCFRHDALKGHVEGVRLRIVVGGKTYSPDLPHAH